MPDTLFSMSCANIIKSHLKLAQIKLTTPLQMLPFKVSTHRKKSCSIGLEISLFFKQDQFELVWLLAKPELAGLATIPPSTPNGFELTLQNS